MLDSVAAGGPGQSLVIEGEPGLGKTTLIRELAVRADSRGFRKLQCEGVQSQSGIGFGGLHELVYPLLGHAGRLPSRQRGALLTAFGIDDGPSPERLLISLAVLGLVEEASHEQPVVLIIDDAQWLDPSTLDVLTFVGRRLANAAALMLCAVRPDTAGQPRHLKDLPRLELGSLDADAAGALLNQAIDGNAGLHDLDDGTRRRILVEAAGNPLALLELSAAVAEHGVNDQLLSDAPLPTTRRIENAFLGQLAGLTDEEQTLLLVVATAGTLSVRELIRAAEELGVGDREFGTLHSCGLMTVHDDRLAVRHPLIRSAVYGAANLPRRTAAHRALAAALENPTRATWHTAAATYSPDETVAAELENAATNANATGAHAEAVSALHRSATLSPDPVDKVRRLTAAAEAARLAGLGPDAIRIIDEALSLQPTLREVIQLEVTRYVLAAMGGAPGRSVFELAALAERFGDVDEPHARHGRAFMLAAASIRWQMYGQRSDARNVVIDSLRGSGCLPGPEPAVSAMLTIAEACIDHRRHASSFAAQAKSLTEEFRTDPLLLSAIALAAEYTWNLEAATDGWTLQVRCAAALDSPAHECDGLRGLAQFQLHAGALREARGGADAALRLADDADLPGEAAAAAATFARASAWLGEFDDAESAIRKGYAWLRDDPAVVWNAHLQWASGFAALTAGDNAKAVSELSRLIDHPQLELWAVGDLTQAAIAVGRPEVARSAVERARDEAAQLDSPFLTMLAQRCLAELSDDPDEAEACFVNAVTAGSNDNGTLELARTRLAFGQWLRRRRRIVASREHLSAAAHTFATSGARPWADRARAELRAAGVTPGVVTPTPAIESLTAQELHIAKLAAEGLSNREIADRIYLSHRTVAAHLYHVFPKLGVTTRGQLAKALQAQVPTHDN
jgi:DNA-binding CsgD family transcriptional regulator